MSEDQTRATQVHGQAGIFAKVAKIMGAIGTLPKLGHNEHFDYKFVTSETVLTVIREQLSKNNLAVFMQMDGFETAEVRIVKYGKEKISPRTTVRFVFTFADGDTGEILKIPWMGEAIDEQDKSLSKAATSAEKYFLLKTFKIATGDEPDSDRDGNKTKNTESKLPLAEALRTLTPGGAMIGTLSADKLSKLANYSGKSNDVTAAMVLAAKVVWAARKNNDPAAVEMAGNPAAGQNGNGGDEGSL